MRYSQTPATLRNARPLTPCIRDRCSGIVVWGGTDAVKILLAALPLIGFCTRVVSTLGPKSAMRYQPIPTRHLRHRRRRLRTPVLPLVATVTRMAGSATPKISSQSNLYSRTSYLRTSSSYTPLSPKGTRNRSVVGRSDSIRLKGFKEDRSFNLRSLCRSARLIPSQPSRVLATSSERVGL